MLANLQLGDSSSRVRLDHISHANDTNQPASHTNQNGSVAHLLIHAQSGLTLKYSRNETNYRLQADVWALGKNEAST